MAKILLIDDDPDVRTVMSSLLHKQGYQVATASSRDEALARLEEEIPSVILSDVLLSGADGRELCREIRANEKTKDVPVIMFSGHPGAALRFESYGANDFMSKPINSEELLAKLSQQMSEVK